MGALSPALTMAADARTEVKAENGGSPSAHGASAGATGASAGAKAHGPKGISGRTGG